MKTLDRRRKTRGLENETARRTERTVVTGPRIRGRSGERCVRRDDSPVLTQECVQPTERTFEQAGNFKRSRDQTGGLADETLVLRSRSIVQRRRMFMRRVRIRLRRKRSVVRSAQTPHSEIHSVRRSHQRRILPVNQPVVCGEVPVSGREGRCVVGLSECLLMRRASRSRALGVEP